MQKWSSLYKAKLVRQIKQLRENGETTSYMLYFKNFPTFDSALIRDNFTVLPIFILSETLEHVPKKPWKDHWKICCWHCQFCKCSQKNALIYSQPPKLNLASPNSEDDVYIYLRALHWAFYSRKSVKIQIKSKCSLKNSKSKILAAISVTKYAVPEKVVIAAIYDGNYIHRVERSTHL